MGTTFHVRVGDNFHLFDESHVGSHSRFDNPEAAIAAAKRIVDQDLEQSFGSTAADLYRSWAQFGSSPWIVASDGSRVSFSASTYAAERAAAMTAQ